MQSVAQSIRNERARNTKKSQHLPADTIDRFAGAVLRRRPLFVGTYAKNTDIAFLGLSGIVGWLWLYE